jgi:DNA polymerase elongation subunit (family B)
MKNVLDKRQLSIKITANSIYGQCGAKTSTFYDMDIAASTTALGRRLLLYARDVIEGCYKNRKVMTKAVGECIVNAEYVYGDTDSVFFKFNPRTIEGEKIIGKPALELTIELAKQAGALATKFLKAPHDLEYEKTFWPFILLSRKRYVGMLYEEDVESCKRKAMGIVLKRRDNAPIVKDIYGGVIDILMKDRDANAASAFLARTLNELASGRVPMDKLVLTKALRGHYKNPDVIAHNVLAQRIGRRDPGNKPRPGDRIEFLYIKTKKRGALQGEKIETPDFVKRQKLEIDYSHYVTNQVMKPIQQVFGLMLEDLDEFKTKHSNHLSRWEAALNAARQRPALKSSNMSNEERLRNKEVKDLLFSGSLARIKRATSGNASIMQFLNRQSGL